jgi:hypothetical protein
MFDPNAFPPQMMADPLAMPEPEPDPTEPFGPDDPYKEYFGRMPRFSQELGAEIFKKAENWKRMTESNGLMRQARENFRFYHNADPSGTSFGDHSFSVDGDGEAVRLRINRFRNFLTHILNMTTTQKVAQQAKAANDQAESLLAATLYDGLLEYYLSQWKRARSSKQLKKATELCLFTPAGHLLMEWDAAAGKPHIPDDGGSIVNTGDLYVKARSFLDVYFDTNTEDEDELDWVVVRDYMNKFELAERFPDQREEILRLESKTEGDSQAWGWDHETDLVPVYKAFWRSSMVLPRGRLVYALSPEIVLKDEDNPYLDDQDQAIIPLLTVRAAEGIGTLFGYCPGNDIAPIQEALNMVWSGVVTNEAAFGVGNVAVERGSDIAVQSLAGGLNVIEYAEGKKAPEPFSVSSNQSQSLNVIELLGKEGGVVTGVNSVVQGNPDDALKAASGRALGLIQAMAVQFQSALQASYQQLVNDFGNTLLLIVKRFAATEQVTAIIGKDRVARMATWKGETFSPVARVVAETVNPLSKTIAGARERGEFLVAQGMVTNLEDFHTIENTGQIEPLIEDKITRNNLIAQENSMLLQGGAPPTLVTDPHDLHVAKHLILLDSPQVRLKSNIVGAVLAHIQEHRDLAAQMNAQQMPQPQPGQQSGTPPPQQGGQSQTPQPQPQEQQAPGPGGEPVPVPAEAQINQPAMGA